MLLTVGASTPVGAQVYGPPMDQQAYGASACGSCAYGPPQALWISSAPLPPAPPQQCFAKVLIPPVIEQFEERVQVTPERTEEVVAAGGRTAQTQSVVQREASVELVSVPPTYRTISETVVVKKASTRIEVAPAVYDTVMEQVKIREAYQEWRPGALVATHPKAALSAYGANPAQGPGARLIEHNADYGGLTTRQLPTGGVLCLVSVPAEYRSVAKQVLRTPSRSLVIAVPQETQTVLRQVVDQPAHVEQKLVPAVYGTIVVKSDLPDSVRTVTVAPRYQTVLKTRLIAPTRFEWRSVACEASQIPPVFGTFSPYP